MRAEIRHEEEREVQMLKRVKEKRMAAVVFLLAVFFMPKCGMNVHAAVYWATVSEPVQTGYATNSAQITWALDYEADFSETKTAGYNVYLGRSSDSMRFQGKTAASAWQFTNLEDGVKYYVRIEPYDVYGNTGGSSRGTVETMPKQVRNFKQSRWYDSIRILDVEWQPVDTADVVTLSLYNSRGRKVESKNLPGSAASTSFHNMKDEVYTIKIQASRTVNGRTYHSSVSAIRCFKQAKVSYAKVSKKGRLTVCWKKFNGVSGYDVYVSAHPKAGYRKVASAGKTKNKVTILRWKGKKFRQGKTYYVYVETRLKTGKRVNKSGRLYYWNTSNGAYGYF